MRRLKKTKSFCNLYGNETAHDLVKRVQTFDEEPEHGISWRDIYEMVQCRGCDFVTMRHSHYFSENPDGPTVSYYPPRVARQTPKWRWDLPLQLRALLDEVYVALHADSRRLALMGARTIVDMVLSEKVGDAGTFQQKLKALEKAGLVAPLNRDFLDAALDAGNAAAHRGYKPKSEQLEQVMDIVENLLQTVYVLKNSAKQLKTSTPARPKKKQSVP